jgi:hypothetical protein
MDLLEFISKHDDEGEFGELVLKLFKNMNSQNILDIHTEVLYNVLISVAYSNNMDIDGGSNVIMGIKDDIKENLVNLFGIDLES